MATSAEPVPVPRDVLTRIASKEDPPSLEMFVKVREPGEFHFYARNVAFADFAASFGSEIRPLSAFIYRLPPALLNPNYWEPLTRESENAVRERMTGIITRTDGDRTLIWRSDGVAPGRLLRDGLEVPAELVHGYVFKVKGEGLLQLGRAWAGGHDRFEWIGFSSLPEGAAAESVALQAHADAGSFRLTTPGARMLFSSVDDRTVRVIFTDRTLMRRAAAAGVRGFVVARSKQPCAAINERVGDQIVRLCDGVGFSADPVTDFIDKKRSYEVTVRLGRTEWGVQQDPGRDPLIGDEKLLIYYDRVSGLWAVAS